MPAAIKMRAVSRLMRKTSPMVISLVIIQIISFLTLSSYTHPGKNAITLFDTGAEYIYDWETFQTGILAEKLSTLETFFVDFEQERGNAFLYQMMELLRTANQKDGRLSLARYAYLLARLEPPKDDPKYKRYKTFSDNMYDWAFTRENRAQLILSFLLYVYQNRGEITKNGESIE